MLLFVANQFWIALLFGFASAAFDNLIVVALVVGTAIIRDRQLSGISMIGPFLVKQPRLFTTLTMIGICAQVSGFILGQVLSVAMIPKTVSDFGDIDTRIPTIPDEYAIVRVCAGCLVLCSIVLQHFPVWY
jgi:hypothetical protein